MIRRKFKGKEFELQYSDDCTFVLYSVLENGDKIPIIDASCLFCDYTDEGFDGIHLDKEYFKDMTDQIEKKKVFEFRFLDYKPNKI